MRLSLLMFAIVPLCEGQIIARIASGADPSSIVVAPGSLVSVLGSGMGPAAVIRADQPYSTTLASYGVVVLNSVSGEEVRALMVSVSGSQARAILPSTVAAGEYDLIYLRGDIRSRPMRFRVAERSFSFFTVTADGSGPAEARAGDQPIGFLSPAQPGQVITLTGTGLGALAGPDQPAAEQPLPADVELRVGKAVVTPTYTGRSGTLPGVDQIRFIMPADAEAGEGCYVPVRAKVSGRWSNIVTVAKVNTGERCQHPLGLSESALKKIDSGQVLAQGNFWIGSAVLDADIDGDATTTRYESAAGNFFRGTGTHLIQMTGEAGPIGQLPGECSSSRSTLKDDELASIDYVLQSLLTGTTFRPPVPLDGGTRVQLTSPSGKQTLLAPSLRAESGWLEATLADSVDASVPRAIAPGEWRVEWPGGREMAGGHAKLNVQDADPLSWTQMLPLIDATQELPLAWQVRGPSEQIFFTGIFLAPESDTSIALGGFHCKVQADARAFTIPAAVMKGMPSTVAGGLAIIAIESRTAVTPFSANFQQMEGELDYGAFDQRFAVVKVREYRR